MARALRAWAINRGGKNLVRNLQYGPRTRLVRGINITSFICTGTDLPSNGQETKRTIGGIIMLKHYTCFWSIFLKVVGTAFELLTTF